MGRRKKLRVKVLATTFKRKGETIRRKGYTYLREDVGAEGRGPEVIPPLEEGALGGEGYFDLSARGRHARLGESVRQRGYRSSLGSLRALEELNKRTNPRLSKIAERDRRWLVKTYGGSWD